jgi:hypothetical protein
MADKLPYKFVGDVDGFWYHSLDSDLLADLSKVVPKRVDKILAFFIVENPYIRPVMHDEQ